MCISGKDVIAFGGFVLSSQSQSRICFYMVSVATDSLPRYFITYPRTTSLFAGLMMNYHNLNMP